MVTHSTSDTVSACNFDEAFEQNFSRIEISADYGRVEVNPADDDRTRVQATYEVDPDKAPDLTWTITDDVLRVEVKASSKYSGRWGFGDVKRELLITAPANVEVDVATQAGSIRVNSRAARVKVRSNAGSVKVVGATSGVTVESNAGSVRVFDCSGEVNLESRAGSVRAQNIDGDVKVESQAGSVRLENVSGEGISIDSQAGSVKGESITVRSAKIDSQAGSVRLEFASAPDSVKLDQQVGSTTLVLPAGEYAVRKTSRYKVEGSGIVVSDAATAVIEADIQLGKLTLVGR